MCVGCTSSKFADQRVRRFRQAPAACRRSDVQVVVHGAGVDVAERQPVQNARCPDAVAANPMMARALLSRLPCVSITPLGLPVVPEVYMIVARSSGLSSASRPAQLFFEAFLVGRAAGRSPRRMPARHGRTPPRRTGLERDDALQLRQLVQHGRHLFELLRVGDEQPVNAGVGELVGDLFGREGRVRRHVHRRGRQNSHVGNQPFEPVFREQADAVTGANAGADQRRGAGDARLAIGVPRQVVEEAMTLVAQCGPRAQPCSLAVLDLGEISVRQASHRCSSVVEIHRQRRGYCSPPGGETRIPPRNGCISFLPVRLSEKLRPAASEAVVACVESHISSKRGGTSWTATRNGGSSAARWSA